MDVKDTFLLKWNLLHRMGISFLVLLTLMVVKVQAQHNVSGKVTNSDTGKPLPGVNIVVKNANKGTFTDNNGKYSLANVAAGDTLIFSFVGFKTQMLNAGTQQILNISMQTTSLSQKGLVVIGYGEARKKDLTGSIGTVKTENLNSDNNTNVAQILAGKIAGVQVTQNNGPGGTASYRIRGATSITAGNEPLFVIDGLPGAPVNALNPQDIKSLQVLKGASAAAIYGSRGANGVILITTKQGQAGKLKVSYNGSVGVQKAANKLNLLNASQYATFINSIREERGQDAIFSQSEINSAGAGTNWQDEILDQAPVQRHQLSFSGGANQTDYYISLNYLNQDGIEINTNIKRYGAHINVDHSEGKFNFGLRLNASQVNNDNIPSGKGFNAGAGVLGSALVYSPLIAVRNPDGSFTENPNQDLDNPVAQANTIFDNAKANRTFGNVFVKYNFLKSLYGKVNFASDRKVSRSDNFISTVTKRGQNTNGSAGIGETENSTYLVDVSLHYDKNFNDVHQINAVADYSYQVFNDRGFNANTQDFPTGAFRTNNLGAGDKDKNVLGSGRSKHQLLSYLGRIKYSFKDRYLLTTTFRVDGSSRFGANHQYGFFPAVAVGWRLSDEHFLSGIKPISELKLRASYGQNGNQAIGNYNSLVLLGTTGQAVFNNSVFTSISPIQLADPDLKWEETNQYNVGLDFGLVNDRVTGSTDYFIKKTSDLLLRLPIPASTGFTSSLQNVGNTQNQGFEFDVNTHNIQGAFNWTTSLNFATLKNKVTDLGGLQRILQGNTRFLNSFTILKPGLPINAYYGYKVSGIFQTQDEVKSSPQPNAKPGFLRFKDVNGDGKITPDDRTVLGNPFPDFTVGFGNDFAYKGLQLHVFLNGNFGQQLLNFNRLNTENPITLRRNRQAYVLNRFTPDNPSTENPSFVQNNKARAINSRVVEDASFVRLRDVKLTYSFSPSLLKNFNISKLSVYADFQNLVTITNYTGYDPSTNVNGTSNVRIDDNAFPLSRTYTAGIHLNF